MVYVGNCVVLVSYLSSQKDEYITDSCALRLLAILCALQ